jgi:hypothetical protein
VSLYACGANAETIFVRLKRKVEHSSTNLTNHGKIVSIVLRGRMTGCLPHKNLHNCKPNYVVYSDSRG